MVLDYEEDEAEDYWADQESLDHYEEEQDRLQEIQRQDTWLWEMHSSWTQLGSLGAGILLFLNFISLGGEGDGTYL